MARRNALHRKGGIHMKACALFLLASACTTTQVLVLPAEGSPLQSANFGLRDRSAKLKPREKESFEVSSIALDQTAADFQDKAGLRRSVPLVAVEEIKYLSPDTLINAPIVPVNIEMLDASGNVATTATGAPLRMVVDPATVDS